MKVMDHMKSLPAMPYTWGTDTELQGAQTHQNTHFHLLQTRLRAAIQNYPLKKIHIGNSCNSLYCKEPKNSALPTSLPQRSAPRERDPKNAKRNAQSFSPHSGSAVAPCHHFSHLALTLTTPQSLHWC